MLIFMMWQIALWLKEKMFLFLGQKYHNGNNLLIDGLAENIWNKYI